MCGCGSSYVVSDIVPIIRKVATVDPGAAEATWCRCRWWGGNFKNSIPNKSCRAHFLQTVNRYLNISASASAAVKYEENFHCMCCLYRPHLAFSLCISSCLSICIWDKFGQFPMHLAWNTHVNPFELHISVHWVASLSSLSSSLMMHCSSQSSISLSISTLKKLHWRPGMINTYSS